MVFTFHLKVFARSEGNYASEVACGKYSDKSDVLSYGIERFILIEI